MFVKRDKKLYTEDWKRTFTPNPYLSKEEEEFVKFCQKLGIEIKIQTSNELERTYSAILKPEYLDSVEENVIRHCKEHGIKYSFYRDLDGNHHYDFSKLVDVTCEELENTKLKLISYDEILNKHRNNAIPIKKIPKHWWEHWWEKILYKLGFARIIKSKPKTEYEHFLETLGYTEETLDDLKKIALNERNFR